MITDPEVFRTSNLSVDNVEVIGDRYLCELIEFSQFLDMGGPVPIMLPEQTQESQGWRPGRVVRVGNGHRLERNETLTMFANVGDIVTIERFSGRYYQIGGKNYVLINQTALLTIVRDYEVIIDGA